MENSRGFTLIELMVTIAVLAVITVMAAPSFSDMRTGQNLNRSTQELITALNAARSKAILERRQDIKVHLNTTNTGINTADTATQLNWQPSGTAKLTSSIVEIKFNLNGGVIGATTDTSFTICGKASGSRSKTVSISPIGTIQQIVEGAC